MSMLTRQNRAAHTETVLREYENNHQNAEYYYKANRYVNSACKQYSFSSIKSRNNQRPNSSTDCKSFEITHFNSTYDVKENQRKVQQIHEEVRRKVDDSVFDKSNKSLLQAEKSIMKIDKPFYAVKCQSKRLNDFVQKQQDPCPIRTLLSQKKGSLSNKFQQIENELDANMLKLKQGFSQVTDESESPNQYTQRKAKECSCQCNQQMRKCHTQLNGSQQTATYTSQEKKYKLDVGRRRSSASFQCTARDVKKCVSCLKTSFQTSSTQTIPQRDYKRKYKDMVEKVRSNELVYLDLKKQNMRLTSETEQLRMLLQSVLDERAGQDRSTAKLRKNVEELTTLHEQYNLQNNHLTLRLKETERQLELNRLEFENTEVRVMEQKSIIAQITQENSLLKQQQEQFAEVEKHIQEIEQLYMQTLNRVHQQFKKQKGLMNTIKQSIHNVIRVSECFRDGLELPLQSLVQHRHVAADDSEDPDLLFSDRSSDGEQIQQIQQRNTEILQSILKGLCVFLDAVAERQIHKLGDLFGYQ